MLACWETELMGWNRERSDGCWVENRGGGIWGRVVGDWVEIKRGWI